MRGTFVAYGVPVACVGIIPACAGNMFGFCAFARSAWDHPRVCGEHHRAIRDTIRSTGSSPRVQGTLRQRRGGDRRGGIIPACAGNTGRSLTTAPASRDHPRVCGEHLCQSPSRIFVAGSSPRVRGTRWLRFESRQALGIIPACAGNTFRCSAQPIWARDHPRVCGEHVPSPHSPEWLWGSSPRVRGTPQVRA